MAVSQIFVGWLVLLSSLIPVALTAPASQGLPGDGSDPRAGPTLGAGAWEATPVPDAYPYFTIFDNAVAAQGGRLVIVLFDRAARPDVSIVLREPDGTWQGPVVLGPATDDHAFPAVAIDSAGYLHVVFGGHANAAYPIQYVRSLQPYDIHAWTAPEVLETTLSSSYNLLTVGAADTLYLAYRVGGADLGDIVFRSKPAGEPWGPPRTLVNARYWSAVPYQLLAEPDGTLHLAFTWRNDRYAPHTDPSYMQSPNGGLTWQTAAGVPLRVPADRPETRIVDDEISHNPGLRLVQDAGGALHVVYSQADPTATVFQVRHWTHSAATGAWIPAPGFTASSFPIGFHVHEGRLRVVATAAADPTQVVEFTLAPEADGWVASPQGTLPLRSQLASPPRHNVAIPEAGLPWTVAARVPVGPAPALWVSVVPSSIDLP